VAKLVRQELEAEALLERIHLGRDLSILTRAGICQAV
jgi:hypothetical protein